MPALKVSVANSEEVRKAIVKAHNSGTATADWPLINSLTHDYQKWFHEIMNAVDTPERRSDAQWDDGEPCWVLIFNKKDVIVAYASLLLRHKVYLSVQQGRILDLYIKEDEDMLAIISVLREAVDNLLWFHWFHQGNSTKEGLKSLRIEEINPFQ